MKLDWVWVGFWIGFAVPSFEPTSRNSLAKAYQNGVSTAMLQLGGKRTKERKIRKKEESGPGHGKEKEKERKREEEEMGRAEAVRRKRVEKEGESWT